MPEFDDSESRQGALRPEGRDSPTLQRPAELEHDVEVTQPSGPGVPDSLDPLDPEIQVPRDPLTGTTLGEYRVGKRIAAGGMGAVYEGEQPVIGKRVAIKVLLPTAEGEAANTRRLLDEARAVNSIRHRGIVDIFSFGELPGGKPYFVMEFLEGKTLSRYIAERRRLETREALEIADEVLSALAAAHKAGVIHRDLKPANIFVCQQPDGARFIKVLDFGIAKLGRPNAELTQQTVNGMAMGTPEYMAPEQVLGDRVSAQTDLYALGIVLFLMLTGKLPFSAATPLETMVAQTKALPPRPSSFVATLNRNVEALVMSLLEKDLARRPGSALDVRERISALLRELDGGGAALVRDTAPSVPPLSTRAMMSGLGAGRRQGLLAAAAGALLFVVGISWWLVRPADEPVPEAPTAEVVPEVVPPPRVPAAEVKAEPKPAEMRKDPPPVVNAPGPDSDAPQAPEAEGAASVPTKKVKAEPKLQSTWPSRFAAVSRKLAEARALGKNVGAYEAQLRVIEKLASGRLSPVEVQRVDAALKQLEKKRF